MVCVGVVRTFLLLFVNHLLLSAGKLVWISKPQHTPVLLGQNLLLSCDAAAEAPSGGALSYKWLFNQTTVQAKTAVFANASLFVPQIAREDAGQYTCVVTLQDGGVAEVMSATAEVVMAYVNNFIMHPQSVRVPVGTEAVLTCVTGRSSPHPRVHWEMDGVIFDSAKTVSAAYGSYDQTGLSSQISMKLMYLVQDDVERVFRCVAVNTLLGRTLYSQEAKVTAEMVPREPVIISSSAGTIIAKENQRLSLPCLVTGYPPPMALWFKDADYVDDSRVYILLDRTLVILTVGYEDAGTYWCEVKNSLGSATSNATTIYVAKIELNFKTHPSDTTSLGGQPVTLHCTPPNSIPPASVTWYKDYTPFVERTGQFAATVVRGAGESWDLFFSSVQESDEGDYYCVASNNFSAPASRTSKVARLSVYGAPVITQPPVNTDVLKGTLLRLTCLVDSATVQSLYWIFDGRKVETSQTVSITDHGQNLWISDVGKSWEGHYTCVAKNIYGQKTASATVTVTVPPVTLQNLGARSVVNGTAVLLPCFIYSAPDPTFVWYHDGQVIVEDSRRKLLSTGLFIDPITVADRGNYSCKGANRAGQAWSNGTLDVRVLPTAVADKSVAAMLGQPLTLTCRVQGHPQPSVHWLHNGTDITQTSASSSDGESHLTLQNFTWPMAGRYSCIAKSMDGIAQADIDVAAQVVPRVLQIRGQFVTDINRSVNLTCVYTGVPAPTISWFHDRQKIDASLDGRVRFPSVDSLLIKFAGKSDEGRYGCTVENALGNSSSYVNVIIVEPPKPPQLVEARPVSVSSVFLRWQNMSQLPATTVDALIIRYRQRVEGEAMVHPEKLYSQTTQWEIGGLKPGTEYVFTVSAENSAGEGPPSNSLTAVTYDSGPSEPRNVRVLSTEAMKVKVSWEVPAETNGNIGQYQLQYRQQAVGAVYSELSVSSPVLATQTVIVEKLTPYTAYEIRVRAANLWQGTLLWGMFSPLVTVRTNMTKPSEAPADIWATAVDPYSIRVEWHPVPETSQHGPITGYRVTYFLENEVTALGTMLTDSSQFGLTVRGLLPWKQYSLTVEAKNGMGFGPASKVVSVRTQPTLPGAPPQDVTADPLPGNVIRAHWQPVPRKDVNCQLASYLVQYRRTRETAWSELSTRDNSTFSADISNVDPWSYYELRVAVTTTQLTPGLGPFSASVEIQTLQSAAGLVGSISFSVTESSVSLTWAPPLQPNGVVVAYRVDFHPLAKQETEKKTVLVNSTRAELQPLLPDVLYNISVAALNQAGIGTPTLLRIRTAPSSSTSVATTAETSSRGDKQEPFTLELMGDMTTSAGQGLSGSRDLPVIVAGSLTGVAILFIILIIFLCRCLKARREHRAKYLIQDEGMSYSRAARSSLYRHFEESDIIVTNRTSASPSPSDHNFQHQSLHQQQQHQQQSQQFLQHEDSTPRQLTDTSWLSQQAQRVEGGAEGPPLYLQGSMTGASPPPLSPGGSDVFIIEGIDNPAFIDDPVSLPGLPPPDKAMPSGAVCPEETDKRASAPKKKRGRMRSESAAAIAVLRSSTSASLVSDDTESLLTDEEFTNVDTQVVFKQRTAL